MSIEKCQIINLPRITDARGNLSFVEEHKNVPFDIKRVYYISNVPNGAIRGGHVNKDTEQLIIALNGRFRVRIRETATEKTFVLDRSDRGLYIPEGLWHRIEDFSQGSIMLALVSSFYDEKDYIRDKACAQTEDKK
jgi:dTDP-4-dehydrorhamnose 3,5-epimerase-like enzyme